MPTNQTVSKSVQMPAWIKGYDFVQGDESVEVKKSEFGDLINSSAAKNFAEGEVFMGRVIAVTDDYVTVDIGYKQ